MKPLNLIKSLTFILPLFVANFTFSQRTEIEIRRLARTGSEQEILVGSSELLQENYFYLSEILIDKLLQKNPISCNYNYRKGYVLLALNENFEKAIAYLEKAVENTDKNYDMYSSSEKSASTDAIYHLAKCYHLNNQLDLAIETFQKFIQQSERKSPLITDAFLHIEQCKIAKTIPNTPSTIETNIGSAINTKKSEYAPVVSFDGKTIYFTSKRQWPDKSNESDKDESTNEYLEDIYYSQKITDTIWSKPKKLEFCLPEKNESSLGITSDERQLFTFNEKIGEGDIFESKFENGSFGISNPINEENVNSANSENHFFMSADKKQIYFVSNKPGGFGGKDIYRKILKNDGNWSDPINLGSSINTAFDETSPFLSFDNETLYFSSNGKTSMGGFDVFESKLINENTFSFSQNLGTPINSTCDELFYSISPDATNAFLSSNRKNGIGEKDIYTFKMNRDAKSNAHLLKIAVSAMAPSTLPESFYVEIKCSNCKSSDKEVLFPRLVDGLILAPLNKCSKYKISFKKDNYSVSFYEEEIQTNCENGYEEIVKNYTIDFNKSEVIPEVKKRHKIKIIDENNYPLENVRVEILSKNTKTELLHSALDGFIYLDFIDQYKTNDSIQLTLKLINNGYLNNTFLLNKVLSKDNLISETYILFKNTLGQDLAKILKLNPIYYETGSSEIKDESKIELDKIIQLLNNNSEINIEIGSHTDCRGDENKNLILSQSRAETAKKYIQEKIKDPFRINAEGYGETKLLIHCPCEKKAKKSCTDEQHKQNRRTEFKIIKK